MRRDVGRAAKEVRFLREENRSAFFNGFIQFDSKLCSIPCLVQMYMCVV